MTKLTQTERMVRLETLMTQALNEIKSLSDKVERMSESYVPIHKHEEDIGEIRQELLEIKSRRWVQNTLSAILGAVLSLLVAYFISTVGG